MISKRKFTNNKHNEKEQRLWDSNTISIDEESGLICTNNTKPTTKQNFNLNQ